jgi:peptidoglycan-associated lipoprotein
MNWKNLLIGTAAATLLAACASTKPQAPEPTVNNMAPQTSASAPVESTPSQPVATVDELNDPNSPLAKRSVYFGFDSAVVTDEYKPTVAAHAAYLQAHSDHKVAIQGNTDARGSREYNLALGQRRAESVKKAMEVLGVPDSQLEAVSFGKEKPIATGTTEADYAQNRRDDIVYDNGK